MEWWQKRKHVLVREWLKIDETFPDNDFTFIQRDNGLWIIGTLLNFFEFECRYPHSYPSGIPDIFPKDRSSKWVKGHQYKKEGRFCLDIREKTWCSRLTAADIIKSLQTLLVAEGIRQYTKGDKLVVCEEPEPTELDSVLRYRQCVFPSDLEVPKDELYGRFNYVYRSKSKSFRLVVTDIFEGEDKRESSLAKLVWLEETLRAKYRGLWVKVTKDVFIKLLVIDDAQKIFECLRTDCNFIGDFDLEEYFGNISHWKIIVFCDEYQRLPFLLSYNSEKKIISRYGTYIFDMKRLKERIPSKDDYEFLSSKKVTIIGCGAGGSKDAEYLVKSGVGKIVLIDDDILQTENILRHSCQLDDLSIEKIYAVEDKLRKINPYIDVSTSRKNLDVIDSNTDKLIHDSDLIIVATAANEALFNEYAFSHGIPAIYSKVYPMGFGGEIIRVIPGVTPCFDCSHHFKEFIIQETMPEAEFPEYGTISYDSLSDGTPVPIPALAVDSDFISLIGVKMALDVLIEKDPKSLVDSSHIRLWGNKKEWIFNQPYQCISIENDSVKSIKNCIICHGDSVIEKELDKTPDQIDNEYNEILSQIKSTAHEEKNGNN